MVLRGPRPTGTVADEQGSGARATIDLPNTKVDALLADTENGLFVAALTSTDDRGYNNNRAAIAATMAAVAPESKKVLWQKDDLLTSNPDGVIDRGILPVYSTPEGECKGYTFARNVQVLDTKTGEAKWTTHVSELPRAKAKRPVHRGRCLRGVSVLGSAVSNELAIPLRSRCCVDLWSWREAVSRRRTGQIDDLAEFFRILKVEGLTA